MTDNDQGSSKDVPVELTALAVLGWVLPLAGLAWGPGQWWTYVIWLAIGTAALVAYQLTHPD